MERKTVGRRTPLCTLGVSANDNAGGLGHEGDPCVTDEEAADMARRMVRSADHNDPMRQFHHQPPRCVVGWESKEPRDALRAGQAKPLAAERRVMNPATEGRSLDL